MPHTNSSPADLLRRYRKNVYPPSLSEDDQTAVKDYLEAKGFEPGAGAVSAESRLKTQQLVGLALGEMGLKPGLAEHAIVGPHAYGASPDITGEQNAISLWVPKPHTDTREA